MVNISTYLSQVSNYFILKGKKRRIEQLMYQFLVTKAKAKNRSIPGIVRKCNYKATPYVYLKLRGRGKRLKYRVRHLSKIKKEAKTIQNLGLTIGTALRLKRLKANSFATTLERELRLWGQGRHPARKKRLEVHVIAKRNAPYRWFKSKKRLWEEKQAKKKANKKLRYKFLSIAEELKIKNKRNLRLKNTNINRNINRKANLKNTVQHKNINIRTNTKQKVNLKNTIANNRITKNINLKNTNVKNTIVNKNIAIKISAKRMLQMNMMLVDKNILLGKNKPKKQKKTK